jgi:23S rRNA maturation mini-RNase III
MIIRKFANGKTTAKVREINKSVNEKVFAETCADIIDKIIKAIIANEHSVSVNVASYETLFTKELLDFFVEEGGYQVKVDSGMMTISW